jgi:hypothetical protein
MFQEKIQSSMKEETEDETKYLSSGLRSYDIDGLSEASCQVSSQVKSGQ